MPDHRSWGWNDAGMGLTRKQLASFVQAGRARTCAGRAGIIQQEGRLPAAEVISTHPECHSALSRDVITSLLAITCLPKLTPQSASKSLLRYAYLHLMPDNSDPAIQSLPMPIAFLVLHACDMKSPDSASVLHEPRRWAKTHNAVILRLICESPTAHTPGVPELFSSFPLNACKPMGV